MPQEVATILALIDQGLIPRFTDLLVSGEEIEVARIYGKKYKLDEYTGRHLDLVPSAYGAGDTLTRREDLFGNNVVLVYHERYQQADEVPDSWMDEHMLFVETRIYDPLTSVRDPFLLTIPVDDTEVTFFVESAEVTVAYDFAMYDQHKVFWSEIEVNFNRLK